MFLFSTPLKTPEATSAPQALANQTLAQPLRAAAESTGVSFDYLVETAKRESSLNPQAKASSSSATGLFQFIEQTWLSLIKRRGADMGLQTEAHAITQDPSGKLSVPDAANREKILELRKNPAVSAQMAGVFTRENEATLRAKLGRAPNGGEVYIAHFLGASRAGDLIRMAEQSPNANAARAFPEAANANRSIFYIGNQPRSVSEVYSALTTHHARQQTPITAPAQAGGPLQASIDPAQAPTRSPLAIATPRNATQTGQLRKDAAFMGFFRSGQDSASSREAANAWQAVAQTRSAQPGNTSYFPRDTAAQAASPSVPQEHTNGLTATPFPHRGT